MNAEIAVEAATPRLSMTDALRIEASQEPDAVATGPVKRESQIIAIYGKAASAKASPWPTYPT